MKKIAILCVLASGLILGGCSAGLKMLQAATVTDAQMQQYVGQYIVQLDAQNTIATGNDPYNVRLNRIAGAINNADGINIKVYKTSDVNAFAVADGSVRVYSGLMDIMGDAEILGVIGHEIGHVKLSHTRKAFQAALITAGIREGLASTGGTVGNVFTGMGGDALEALSSANFSQKDEYEADDYGYNFLKAHGLNPYAMAQSFEKLKQMEGGRQTDAVSQLFSTHPNLDARIGRMVARAAADGYTASGKTGTGTGAATKPSGSGSGQWSF